MNTHTLPDPLERSQTVKCESADCSNVVTIHQRRVVDETRHGACRWSPSAESQVEAAGFAAGRCADCWRIARLALEEARR